MLASSLSDMRARSSEADASATVKAQGRQQHPNNNVRPQVSMAEQRSTR